MKKITLFFSILFGILYFSFAQSQYGVVVASYCDKEYMNSLKGEKVQLPENFLKEIKPFNIVSYEQFLPYSKDSFLKSAVMFHCIGNTVEFADYLKNHATHLFSDVVYELAKEVRYEYSPSDYYWNYGLMVLRSYGLLRDLFAHRGQYGDYLSIVETYLRENNFTDALATINQMLIQFNLTDYGRYELDGMIIYVQWLEGLLESGRNIYELSSNEIDKLINYVESNVGRGVVFANNILCMLYNICLEEEQTPQYAPPQYQEEETENEDNSYGLKVLRSYGLDNISLHPNPTTGELRVTSYELQVTDVEVYDIYGRKLLSHTSLLSPETVINISHLQNGIYFIKVITESGEVVKKVVKL